MQSSKIFVWLAVFFVGTILASAPQMSVTDSTAQPTEPFTLTEEELEEAGTTHFGMLNDEVVITQEKVDKAVMPTSEHIAGLPPMAEVMAANDETLDRMLSQSDQRLEKQAAAEGRTLGADEYTKVVRRMMLRPHSKSSTKDLMVEGFELSNGQTGHFLTSPLFKPEVRGPFGYEVEEVNLDEGWYKARLITAAELKAEQDQQQAKSVEPQSFLRHLLDFLNPSAHACTIHVKSVMARVEKKSDGSAQIDDGVKLWWGSSGISWPGIPPLVWGAAQRCIPRSGWVATPSCGGYTLRTLYTGGWPQLVASKQIFRDKFYFHNPPGHTSMFDGIDTHAEVVGKHQGLSFINAFCTIDQFESFTFRCVTLVDAF